MAALCANDYRTGVSAIYSMAIARGRVGPGPLRIGPVTPARDRPMPTTLKGERTMDREWTTWIGRRERSSDRIGASPLARLAATLDRNDPPPCDGDPLPPLSHWLYFLPAYRECDVGPDGHAHRGAFLPPVPLPRRMWAGGRLTFHAPLHVGEVVSRESQIVDVVLKQGRSGPLVFVVVRHTISGEGGVAIVEEHDIVYRGGARGAAGRREASRSAVRARRARGNARPRSRSAGRSGSGGC